MKPKTRPLASDPGKDQKALTSRPSICGSMTIEKWLDNNTSPQSLRRVAQEENSILIGTY